MEIFLRVNLGIIFIWIKLVVFQVKYPKQFFEKEILDRMRNFEADLPKRILSLDISGIFYPSISNLLYERLLVWIKSPRVTFCVNSA